MNAETKRCFAALLRKQRREQSAFLNRSARTGKQRTQTGKLAFGALYGAIALVLMALLKGSKALDKLAVQW